MGNLVKCGEIRDRLTAYLDLELSFDERQILKDHLSACSLCTRELNDLKKVGQWVHLSQSEPDPYFERQMLRVVKSARSGSRKAKAGSFSLGDLFRLPLIRKTALASIFAGSLATAYYLGVQSHPFWVAQSVGVSQGDLERINREIDFYKDFEVIHQLDLLKKMEKKKEDRGGESL